MALTTNITCCCCYKTQDWGVKNSGTNIMTYSLAIIVVVIKHRTGKGGLV